MIYEKTVEGADGEGAIKEDEKKVLTTVLKQFNKYQVRKLYSNFFHEIICKIFNNFSIFHFIFR